MMNLQMKEWMLTLLSWLSEEIRGVNSHILFVLLSTDKEFNIIMSVVKIH